MKRLRGLFSRLVRGPIDRWFGADARARLALSLLALWKLLKHPATPRAPKAIALLVLAYALSPIDLIPDFIPVLGLLDELVLLPLAVAAAVRLTPPALWQARLREAEADLRDTGARKLPKLLWGAALVVGVWAVVAGGLGWWAWAAWSA